MENFPNRLFIIQIILLLLIVYCNCKGLDTTLRKYANRGEIVDDLFKPDQKLGEGSFGYVWKGKLIIISFQVNFIRIKLHCR